MHGKKLLWSFVVGTGIWISFAPATAGAQAVFNVLDYGANPAPNTADDAPVHQAFCDAMAASGTLFFPAGHWDLATPLDLGSPGSTCTATPGRVTLAGVGRTSLVEYIGSGAAAIVSSSGGNGQFSAIRDLFLRGSSGGVALSSPSPITGISGQSGIALASPRNVSITRVVLERFQRGYGIFLKLPVSATVSENQIGASQVAIGLRTPNGVEVSKNAASAWAVAGILLFSDPGDAVTTRNNSVRENLIQGATLLLQEAPQSRAGIKIDSVSSTEISNNTIERILAPGPGYAGHGIWLTRSTANLNQSNAIRGNYFGQGTQGDGIRIADGLVSHTLIEGNALGGYTLRDDGVFTVFQLQYLADPSQLTGTPNSRRGWLGLPTGVVQMH